MNYPFNYCNLKNYSYKVVLTIFIPFPSGPTSFDTNTLRVVYFVTSLTMSSTTTLQRALDASFRSQMREKTPVPLPWLYNNQERPFFQHWLCDVVVSLVCCVSASTRSTDKKPASFHFKTEMNPNKSIRNAPTRISLCNYLRSHYQTAALTN